MKKTYRHEVTLADTALALGSGDVQVLATPRLIAWMEAASMESVRELLEEHETTVGTEVKVEHVKGLPVGSVVNICVGKPVKDGRRLLFHVTAADDDGAEVGSGTIARAKVDREKFMAKARGLSDQTATLPIVKAQERAPGDDGR